MRKGIVVDVTTADRALLEAVVANRNSPQKHVWRASIILLTADGLGTNAIQRGTGRSKSVVWRWQERFMQEGVDGLLRDKTRPPGRKPLDAAVIERVVGLTAQDPPAEATHWTAAMMAKTIGISVSSVQRIWQAHGLQPHHYKRHGTTTLFAALNILEGKVIGRCMQRHRHQEFIRFLNAVEAETPVGKIVHVVLDNYATHKHPKVKAWLARHPRFVFHFTPKSCSWLNAVETLFSRLSRRRLKRGVFRSIVDLQAAINRFLAETNADPKPFVWTAHPDRVIAAVQRGMQALESVH